MKRLSVLFLCFMLLFSFSLCHAEQSEEEPVLSDLDNQFIRIFRSYRTVGASLLVARNGEVVYRYDYGYSDRKARETVEENTYFLIASVTKFVTGIHVMQLVERGLLSLDEDISVYLGYKVQNPYYPQVPLTLRMLMTHTSSLSMNGSYSNSRRTLESLISTDRNARSNYYKEKPGSKYRYSNFGAGVLGSLIEAVTGKNVDDSIRESLFEPLGIDGSYAASRLKTPSDITNLYTAGSAAVYKSRSMSISKEWDPSVNPDRHYRITVGRLWLRNTDLCRLGIMLCNGGTLDGISVLRPETVAEMMKDQQGGNVITADTPYGLCVHRDDTLIPGGIVFGHQGLNEDVVCNIYMHPESGFVFSLVTNGCNNALDHRVAKVSRRLFTLAWETFGPSAD